MLKLVVIQIKVTQKKETKTKVVVIPSKMSIILSKFFSQP